MRPDARRVIAEAHPTRPRRTSGSLNDQALGAAAGDDEVEEYSGEEKPEATLLGNGMRRGLPMPLEDDVEHSVDEGERNSDPPTHMTDHWPWR